MKNIEKCELGRSVSVRSAKNCLICIKDGFVTVTAVCKILLQCCKLICYPAD